MTLYTFDESSLSVFRAGSGLFTERRTTQPDAGNTVALLSKGSVFACMLAERRVLLGGG